MERRYLEQAQPAGMAAALERAASVRLIAPERCSLGVRDERWLDGVDAVVARGRSTTILCLLAWAEARGLPTINSRRAVGAVHNKAEMAVALARAGIPTPSTYVGPPLALTERVPSADYPLLLKPVFGDNCRGLRIVRDRGELERLHWAEPVALAQPLLASDGVDLKLYGIGERVWAVRKRSPFRTDGVRRCPGPAVQPLALDAGLEQLGLRCGRLFGLELWGVDCIETPAGPVVIEVNEFPNYTGVPDADELLAEQVLGRARCEAA